jgi:hypothetical protein
MKERKTIWAPLRQY